MLLDNSIENKNQLFELLGVKKQITQYKKIQMNDSILSGYSSQTLYIDSLGYAIKKEKQYSNPNDGYHSESLFIFERDSNGNIIKILEDGELKETRIYNEMKKIKRWDLYRESELDKSGTYEYDSSGNEIQYSYQHYNGDTLFTVKNKYDKRHSLPVEKAIVYFETDIEYSYYNYDSTGRITKEFTVYADKNIDDSTLYYYDYDKFKDSTIHYYDGHIQKSVRECDKNWRPFKLYFYNVADSLLEQDILEYEDKGIKIRDSILTANDIEIRQKPYDEMMEEQIVAKMIVNGEVSFITTTSYYPNGLLKQMTKSDYDQNRIEKTYYEYEFY
jgi:hypothetical protein